eukprot:gene1718-biopygen10293
MNEETLATKNIYYNLRIEIGQDESSVKTDCQALAVTGSERGDKSPDRDKRVRGQMPSLGQRRKGTKAHPGANELAV